MARRRTKADATQVPISGERLLLGLRLRGISQYQLARLLTKRSPKSFASMKEAIRVICSGAVSSTAQWRHDEIEEALALPAGWLAGEDSPIPWGYSPGRYQLRVTRDDGAEVFDWVPVEGASREPTAAELAGWDLMHAWGRAAWGAQDRLADIEDERNLVAGIADANFLDGRVAVLLNPAIWRARFIVGEPYDPTAQWPEDLDEAAVHLAQAFRIIMRPWESDPTRKADLQAMDDVMAALAPGLELSKSEVVPSFILGVSEAVVSNEPRGKEQRERAARHAKGRKGS